MYAVCKPCLPSVPPPSTAGSGSDAHVSVADASASLLLAVTGGEAVWGSVGGPVGHSRASTYGDGEGRSRLYNSNLHGWYYGVYYTQYGDCTTIGTIGGGLKYIWDIQFWAKMTSLWGAFSGKSFACCTLTKLLYIVPTIQYRKQCLIHCLNCYVYWHAPLACCCTSHFRSTGGDALHSTRNLFKVPFNWEKVALLPGFMFQQPSAVALYLQYI